MVETKLVLVLREGLPTGAAVNAAAVLGLSLAGRLAAFVGADGVDASGGFHAGLNTHPVPVLTASADELTTLRARAAEHDGLTVVGFSDVAREARDYGDYLARLAATPAPQVGLVGLVVFGPRGAVTRLTKRLALLR